MLSVCFWVVGDCAFEIWALGSIGVWRGDAAFRLNRLTIKSMHAACETDGSRNPVTFDPNSKNPSKFSKVRYFEVLGEAVLERGHLLDRTCGDCEVVSRGTENCGSLAIVCVEYTVVNSRACGVGGGEGDGEGFVPEVAALSESIGSSFNEGDFAFLPITQG